MNTLRFVFLGFLLLPSWTYAAEFSVEEMLALAKASPVAVEAHDRSGWLDLFTDDAVVEDPVGAPILQKKDASDPVLLHFYETFIAASQIHFVSHRDFAAGSMILRDVTIETKMSPDCQLAVPAFVRYDLRSEGERLRLAGLHAYWELGRNVSQLASLGFACSKPSLALTQRMLKELGGGYSLGYGKALISVGSGGQKVLKDLADKIKHGDRSSFLKHFTPGAAIECREDGTVLSPDDFWDEVQSSAAPWDIEDKIVSAGRSVVARVSERIILLDFAKHGLQVERMRCFFPLKTS